MFRIDADEQFPWMEDDTLLRNVESEIAVKLAVPATFFAVGPPVQPRP